MTDETREKLREQGLALIVRHTEMKESYSRRLFADELAAFVESAVQDSEARAASDFAILSRACGNWRDWPEGTVIGKDAQAPDAAHQDWQAAARAIIERDELRTKLAAAESAVQSARNEALEEACKAECTRCAAGMPVEYKVCFVDTSDRREFYHVFRKSEDWWKKLGLSEWFVRDNQDGETVELHDPCNAKHIRAGTQRKQQKEL